MPDMGATGGSGPVSKKKKVAESLNGDSQPSPSPSQETSLVPAAQAKPSRITKRTKKDTALSPQRLDPLWQLLDSKIGGREGLLAAALASTNVKAKDLVGLILDKSYRTFGTKALCKRAGLSAPEVVDMFRDRKWLEATLAIHEELPDIIRGAAEDAKPGELPCPECKGKGGDWNKGDGGEACYVCGGKGKLRRPGDKDKLKFIGEAANLTGKQAPVFENNLQIVNNNPTNNISFEDLMRKAALNTKPKVIEVINASEDPEN